LLYTEPDSLSVSSTDSMWFPQNHTVQPPKSKSYAPWSGAFFLPWIRPKFIYRLPYILLMT
jgi:hypothetical protein